MNIVECEHPVRVYNKALGDYVFVSCGKCNTCRKKRASRWVARLENERQQHPYTFFVTLTYDEKSLPRLHRELDPLGHPTGYLIDWRHDEVELLEDDLRFSSKSDMDFYNDMLTTCGVAYANKVDVQKFLKRLNKHFHDKVSKKYANFRYFCVSEYGSTTYRPHFHFIFFCDDKRVADNFAQGIYSSWHFGIVDTQFVEKSACSYVAQYLNSVFDLPSFYKNSVLRPFMLCSKRPSLGAFNQCTEDDKEIYFNRVVTRPLRDSEDPTKIKNVPLFKNLEDRLFPKIIHFDEISDSLRIALYRLSGRFFGEEKTPYLRTFDDFLSYVRKNVYSFQGILKGCSEVQTFLSLTFDHFSETGINRLRRLYYISKRVIRNAVRFGISVDEYVAGIVEYWNKKERLKLKSFYEFQESYSRYSDSDNLVYCYPNYCFVNNPADFMDMSKYSIRPLKEVDNYKSLCRESAFLQDKHTKTHFKNAYFEGLSLKNNFLFNLIKNYHAKKRYETAETCA